VHRDRQGLQIGRELNLLGLRHLTVGLAGDHQSANRPTSA
jgi:hypothetical protein